MTTDPTDPMETVGNPAARGPKRRRSPAGLIALAIVLVAFAAAYFLGIVPRQRAQEALSKETRALAVPTVAVTTPRQGDANAELILPGNLQPYIDTPIYARASGYLKHWTADIGSTVKKGELLAEIEAPELDAQLQKARADVSAARATFEQAQKTAGRWQELVRTGSVSAQDADLAQNTMRTRRSELDAAQQEVARLERVQGYRRIHAPFSGIITARNAETGGLIDAGAASGPGRELFRLSATEKLRVFVNVPQAAAKHAVPGAAAELSLTEYPGRKIPGKLVRTAKSIDAGTRTLLAEIEVDNSKGELLPGSYAQVRLKIPATVSALIVPINTLLFRAEGPQVAVVGPSDKTVLKNVTIGRDFGTTVELLAGLEATDRVILNPADSIDNGTQVRVVEVRKKEK